MTYCGAYARREGQSAQTMFSCFFRRTSSFFFSITCSLSAADVMAADSPPTAQRALTCEE